jgi:hypothetical protein
MALKTSYEPSDLSFGVIAGALAGLAVMLFVWLGISSVTLRWLSSGPSTLEERHALLKPHSLPPPPRLQADPAADLAELHAREDNLLNQYGWVDRNKGIVHIPIDQAIDQVAARHGNL